VVNKINLLHKPLLRYQYFNDSIKNKKWHFFDFEITTCKTTRKRQKEGQFTTPVPVEPFFDAVYEIDHPDKNGRGGFQGTSYDDAYNGFRGFPGRKTSFQEHESVSWSDAGLPIHIGSCEEEVD
jgi:hypothetical protein